MCNANHNQNGSIAASACGLTCRDDHGCSPTVLPCGTLSPTAGSDLRAWQDDHAEKLLALENSGLKLCRQKEWMQERIVYSNRQLDKMIMLRQLKCYASGS